MGRLEATRPAPGRRLPALLLGLALLAPSLRAGGGIPRWLSFQGRLEDPAGQPMTGLTTVQMTLYAVAESGTPLWSETDEVVLDDQGVFVTTLGDQSPLTTVPFDNPYFLGLSLDQGATELAPRTPLVAAPYALRSLESNDAVPGPTGPEGPTGPTGPTGLTGVGRQSWEFSWSQPNGSGIESSSNQWVRVGAFVYRGTAIDATPTQAQVVGYTTNTNTYYRFRLRDVTNAMTLATSAPSNLGTNASPEAVDLGVLTNLPAFSAILELQILATDITGNTGVTGRLVVGVHSFQMWE